MRMRLHPRTNSRGRSDSGYILLVLMLWVAVLSITVTMPMIYYYRQQMIRDREEELVHRGVEYERAVRKYYKKFGTYPASLDLLESANHMRFLRRRYKDPINRQDFKVLTMADVMTTFAAGIPGSTIPGAQSLGTPVSNLASGSAPAPAPQQDQSAPPPPPAATGADASAASSDASSAPVSSNTTLPFGAKSTSGNNGQTFGGGGVVGVASVSKAESIRVFNKKNHYNEWLFAYNPQTDRGGLPRGPYEPTLPVLPGQMGLPGQQLNGQQGAAGQQGLGQQGFGQQGFGGIGNSFGSHR